MTTALVFVIGPAAIGGVLVWLARTNSADTTRLTEALGLQPAHGVAEAGDDPVFDAAYRVTAPEGSAAVMLLTPKVHLAHAATAPTRD